MINKDTILELQNKCIEEIRFLKAKVQVYDELMEICEDEVVVETEEVTEEVAD